MNWRRSRSCTEGSPGRTISQPYDPTALDGQLGSLPVDDPNMQEMAELVDDATRGPLAPTEDGYVVAPNGNMYEDPTVDYQQPSPHNPYVHEPAGAGDYIPAVTDANPYEASQSAPWERDQGGGDDGGGSEE